MSFVELSLIRFFLQYEWNLPQAQHVLILVQRHNSPVHGLLVRGEPNVELLQGAAPLLHQQLEAILAAARDTTTSHVQVLNVPAGQPDQGRVRDALAPADVEQAQLGRLFQYPLNLLVVHAVKVAALVHPDGQLLQQRKAGRHDLLAHRHLVQAEHGVGGAEGGEQGAAALQLLYVDEDGVARGGGDVGHVQASQVLGVLLKIRKL